MMNRAWTISKTTGKAIEQSMVESWDLVRLTELLRNGVVMLTYKKKDGRVTTRRATLQVGGKGCKSNSSKVVTYYDLGVGDFRCFKVENLVGYEAV